MRTVQIQADGRFATRIAALLQAEITVRGHRGRSVDALLLLDGFDPRLIRENLDNFGLMPVVLAFPTVRGFFVSAALGRAICFDCFERRWMANLSAWEHSASQEVMLRTLFRFQPALRPSTFSDTAVELAAALCREQVDADPNDRRSLYADLTTGQISWGETWGVHGCEACYPEGRGFKRHLVGFATLSSQWGNHET